MITTVQTHDSISLRAYYLWDGEGRPDGRHEAHWLAAEAVEARSAVETRESKPATARAAKAPAARKAVSAKKAGPKAAPETVVAAAALSAPRRARTDAKGIRRTH